MAWDDTRNGDAVGQAQDIYSADVQHRELGGGTSKAAKVALAAVVGLLLVGLGLLAMSFLTRGRGGDKAATTTGKATAKPVPTKSKDR